MRAFWRRYCSEEHIDCLQDGAAVCICCAFCCWAGLMALIVTVLLVPHAAFRPEPLEAERSSSASDRDLLAPSTIAARADIVFKGRAEPAALLHRDVESEPGLFERLALARSRGLEVVLLTSDTKQLDMTLSLVANLEALEITHYLLLGQDKDACGRLDLTKACVWSSYLMEPGNQSALGAIRVGGNPRLWLQRHHYLGRLIGAGLRPLLLDSDVVLARNPYPYLHAPPFARFHALVLGDSTARPLKVNGGVWYVRNASRAGPLRALFAAFDARVARVLARAAAQLQAKRSHGGSGARAPAAHDPPVGSADLFDQKMLNELLPPLVAPPRGGAAALLRVLYRPLRLVDPDLEWRWSCCYTTPSGLPAPGGSYPRQHGLRWVELTRPGAASGGGDGGSSELLAKAPPWLFSAESDFSPPAWPLRAQGVRVDSRGWGRRPAPWVLLHLVCTAWPHSDGRRQALRAWGFWADRAIEAALPEVRQSAHKLRAAMVALARPIRASSLAEVREWMRLLVAAAARTGRTAVLPYMACDRALLDERCLWVVHEDAAADAPPANSSGGGGDSHARGRRRRALTPPPHSRPPPAPPPPPPVARCLLRWPKGCADQLLLPAEARLAAAGSVQRVAPATARELSALLAADAAPGRPHARPRLLSLDLGTRSQPWQAAFSAAHFAGLRLGLRGCGIHTVTRCQAVC